MTAIATKTILSRVTQLITEPLEAEGRPLRILMVSAESSPYANVGGQSRVLAYLSKSLIKLGHDVRIFIPKFGLIDEERYKLEMVLRGLKVPTGHVKQAPKHLLCNVKSHQIPGGALTYFLENQEYYEKRANVYGYGDDPTRWALLCRGALEFLSKNGDWRPDIIHSHDWHTGLVANYLASHYPNDPKLLSVATVCTLHNLKYQGNFDHRDVSELDYDDGRSQIASLFRPRLKRQNFMRRGILYSDIVTTVSKNYAREILTPEFGEGLDKLLLELRSKLFGIINGIDYEDYNPATDPHLAQNYTISSLEDRTANKRALQPEFGLIEDETKLVLGHVGRLDDQKGLDLIFAAMWPLLREFDDIQFVQVGGGSRRYAEVLKKLKVDFPGQVGIHPLPNFTLPRLIFAGADVMLLPSKFEPCGLVQMEAMRYGCVPIVRQTGGLTDTVTDFNPQTLAGTGFVFAEYDRWPFFAQLIRAYETFRYPKIWRRLQRNGMSQDFSWESSAREYLKVYEKALHFKRTRLQEEGLVDIELTD